MKSYEEPFVERRIAPPIETDIQIGLRQIVESIYGPAAPRLPHLDIGRSYLGTARDFIYTAAILSTSFIAATDALPWLSWTSQGTAFRPQCTLDS
jgi:hypothetical protein